MDFLRPYLARIIGGLVAGFLTYLAGKGITLSGDHAQVLTDAGVAIAMTFFSIIYAVVHKVLNKKLNPGDAASTHLAVLEKAQTAALKKEEKLPPTF